MLSKAFLKSTKFKARGKLNSLACSMMLRRVKIWSQQDRFGRKPACSSHRVVSNSSCNLCMRTALPGMERSVIPLQLLQFARFPFFGSLTTIPLVQFSGTVSCSHIKLNKQVSQLTTASPPYLSNSANILLIPATLLFLRALIAVLTSFLVIFPRITLRSGLKTIFEKSKVEGGSGWFKTYLKCSTHLAFCFSFFQSWFIQVYCYSKIYNHSCSSN